MSVLSDKTLREMHLGVNPLRDMIHPFHFNQVREKDGKKVISYGVSSYGYDVRLALEAQVFSNHLGGQVDPKNFNCSNLVDAQLRWDSKTDCWYFMIPPNSYLLGVTMETFDIPDDVLVLCIGKSTYARSGLIINVTPIEPGFKGTVVIEIANSTSLPVRVYAEEGIAQFIFLKGDQPCDVSYAKRNGKYQGQTGITPSKV